MADTQVSPQAQDADDIALYAGADDRPREARIRRSLVRLFATTAPVFLGHPPSEYPALAADVAMRIVGPALEMVTADAEATIQRIKTGVGGVAEELVTRRIKVIEAAARASERAACVQQLRDEAAHLAAVALESRGPEVAVVARDVVALESAARWLASQPTT